MKKNCTSDGDAIMTKEAEEAFLSFVSQVKIRELSNGIRNLHLYFVEHEADREQWYEYLLFPLQMLFFLLDELEEIYGPE